MIQNTGYQGTTATELQGKILLLFPKEASAASSEVPSYEPTPYDYQDSNSGVNVENDPFAEFGDSVSIDDNFLE